MPTFTTIAWETLLEPRVRDSYQKNPLNSKQHVQSPKSAVAEEDDKGEERSAQAPKHVYFSPALYVTPEPTPIPDFSSDPLSPSPYVVNHKRRGGEGFGRRINGFDEASGNEKRDLNAGGDEGNVAEEVVEEKFLGVDVAEGSSEEDDFFNPRCDSAWVDGLADVGDCVKQAESRSYVSNQGEFFDAPEDFSSDGSSSNFNSCGARIESELQAAKQSLLDEIEKRKAAECALDEMHNHWQRLHNVLSELGISLPSPPNSTSRQLEIDLLEQFYQELFVARFVAKAIGSGQARAEAEIAAQEIIESKDKEISRLRDRLQYYETVNREMTQRNQEIIEAARKQRQRKRTQRRWLWSCLGLSVMIGASAIAYFYLPQMSKPHTEPSSSDPSDASCISSPESV